MIREYNLENSGETYLRIWQKITFGKEILESVFFEENNISDTQNSYRLKINQFDPNTRLFYLEDILYFVTSEEPIYNYLDNGRVVSLKQKYMDGDEPYKQKTNSNTKFSLSNVFQSDWIRRTIQDCDGIDRFILDNGCNFLPYITIISWIIFLLTRN